MWTRGVQFRQPCQNFLKNPKIFRSISEKGEQINFSHRRLFAENSSMDILNAVLKNVPKKFHRRLKFLRSKSESGIGKLFFKKKRVFCSNCSSRQGKKVVGQTRPIFVNKSWNFFAQNPKTFWKFLYLLKKLSSKRYPGNVESRFENLLKKFARKPYIFANL